MTPGLRDAIHTNAWLLTATGIVIAGSVLLVEGRKQWRRWWDVQKVHAAAARFADQDPYGDEGFDEEFDPTDHVAGDPRCHICREAEQRHAATDREFFALIAPLKKEQS